ncbi:UDP-galactopyranose/dTDP-fucopyranose mutase family protein [Micromonospora sp. RP3T]|uniref:UDP-galactopyranose/dTDP-fucopyranose mutase family protein n=1 Tax=Micromonospora sp. RP3T TaxID=2135446 RepID=UPI003D729B60
MPPYDLVVVGAGPTGATVAETAARTRGWRVLVVERRSHVAGNCYDATYPGTELLWHCYGPHYLRFTRPGTMAYVGMFTEWLPGNYVVRAEVDGVLVPMPINLETIELLYGQAPLDETSARELIAQDIVATPEPTDSEQFILSRAGRRLYEKLYANYTRKQWGRSAAELDPSVCGRIPIRFDRNPYYVDSPYQVMPRDGYTALFDRMLRSSPNIETVTDVDWTADRIHGRAATVFCGPLDEYFGHRLGPLPWRSLRFETEVVDQPWYQPCVQVNYPGVEPYTRKVEVKHVTRQVSGRTVVVTEYPSDVGDPYYPVPMKESRARYERYRKLTVRERESRQVFFAGRLGTYRYINTDEAIERARALADRLA